jgi:flagellin-like hook-associated protein FlgL
VSNTGNIYYYEPPTAPPPPAAGVPLLSGNAVLQNGNVMLFRDGEWVTYDALQFLGEASSITPYRGGYHLDGSNDPANANYDRTAPGIYTQNVTMRGGSNLTKQNFFGVLDDIGAAIRAENRDGLADKLLPLIDRFMDSLLKIQSSNGALQVRYEGNISRMKLNDISMTEAHDELTGIDFSELTTQLMMAQAIYQASLGVIAYIVQPTLLDFLR